jgi:hypothetical protein
VQGSTTGLLQAALLSVGIAKADITFSLLPVQGAFNTPMSATGFVCLCERGLGMGACFIQLTLGVPGRMLVHVSLARFQRTVHLCGQAAYILSVEGDVIEQQGARGAKVGMSGRAGHSVYTLHCTL